MSIAFTRGMCRAAVLCLVSAVMTGAIFAQPAAASTAPMNATKHAVVSQKTTLGGDVRGLNASTPKTIGGDTLSFAPATQQPMTVVYLHGIHGKAENGCPHFRNGASEVGWLVCPKATEREADGRASWMLDVNANAATVSHALGAAVNEGASSEPGVAVGFSQGGYITMDLVKSGKVHFKGLVLIAAPEQHPSAAKLHEMGVSRVVLAAGQRDAAYWPLKKDAQRLADEGMDVKFVDLGDVGHTYAAENTQGLHDAIVWAAGRS
jgi:predicted esterase